MSFPNYSAKLLGISLLIQLFHVIMKSTFQILSMQSLISLVTTSSSHTFYETPSTHVLLILRAVNFPPLPLFLCCEI